MKKLEQLRAYIQQSERRAPRKKKLSAAAEQKSAQLAKRKVEVTRKARALLERVKEIDTIGECDEELRRMRDELVEGLWVLRHTRREVKGQLIKVLQ